MQSSLFIFQLSFENRCCFRLKKSHLSKFEQIKRVFIIQRKLIKLQQQK
jgi:hypothetical protein